MADDTLRELVVALRTDIRVLLDEVGNIRTQLAVLIADSARYDEQLKSIVERLGNVEMRVTRGESQLEGGVSMRGLVFTIIGTIVTVIGGLVAFLQLFGKKQ